MTIYAISIATNLDRAHNFQQATQALRLLGQCTLSNVYEIPCRDGVGADYWNAACLVESKWSLEQIQTLLKQMEDDSGRKRPSHDISLDMDLIAWGNALDDLQFNPNVRCNHHDQGHDHACGSHGCGGHCGH